VLRHYLRGKVAPIAPALRTRGVQTRAPERALKHRARDPHLAQARELGAPPPAIPLAAITAPAHQHLPATLRSRTSENPKRLLDHRRSARRFLDKRREPSDTALADRATTRRMKARRISPGFRYLAGTAL
jgi:hypothetical protein